jgi:hypothetical protein
MVASISIVIEPVSVQIQPGGRASARLSFINRGDTVGQYVLSVSGLDPSWFKLDATQVGVFPSDRSSVQLSIRLPATAVSATYRVLILAQNQMDPTDQAQTALDLTVNRLRDGQAVQPAPGASPQPVSSSQIAEVGGAAQSTVMRPRPQGGSAGGVDGPRRARFGEVVLKSVSSSGQLQLVVDRDGLKLQPGANQSLQIGLTNSGGVEIPIELTVKGAPLSWLILSPASLVLPPGATDYARLTATIPLQTPIGSYPLTLITQSGEDAGLTARVNMMLEVTRPGAITVELNPTQVQGESSGEFMLQISQTGQSQLSVNLSAQDAGGLLDYGFTPAVVVLPEEGKATSRLVVRPRQALTASEAQMIPFDVTAAPSGGSGAAASVQGRFVHQRSLPVKLLMQTDEVRDPAQAAFQLRMVNPGQSPLVYRLSASDPGGSCVYQFETPVLNLPARGEASTVLHVTPQTYHSAGEIIHTVRVTVQPASGPGSDLTAAVRYIQTAGQPPQMTLVPASQTSSGPATYQVQIINPRPVPLQIEVRAVDQSQQCQFRIDPASLNIAPMHQSSVRLEVHPVTTLLPAETRRACGFSVLGYADYQPKPITVEGTLLLVHGFTWRKLLPLFIVALLILGAGGIAVLVLLWTRFMP